MRKNIICLVAALCCMTLISKAESVAVDDFTVKQGETIQVTLQLDNEHNDLTAFSMKMQLPAGLTLTAAEATGRYAGEIIIGNPAANVFNIMGLEGNLATITGNEGALLTLTFEASKSFKGGEATITAIEFITPERDYVEADDTSFYVDYEQGQFVLPGDADTNGIVNVSDVMTVVAYVLKNLNTSFDFNNADVNGNGIVDVVDAMLIVDIILGRN